MITVILDRVEHPGNLGAVARVMKNFGCEKLLLLNPRCAIDDEAENRAKHAQEILHHAKTVKALPPFDLLIGTTALLGSDYNLPRTPLTPGQLGEKLRERDGNIGILFGCESDGLSNERIEQCDFTVSIPTSKEYAALNLSHAVGILLYEVCKKDLSQQLQERFPLVKHAEKEQLQKMINETLEKLHFPTEEKRETQELLWKRLIGKSMLTQREAMALMGFFRKLQ